jgi:hypothetical protein
MRFSLGNNSGWLTLHLHWAIWGNFPHANKLQNAWTNYSTEASGAKTY